MLLGIIIIIAMLQEYHLFEKASKIIHDNFGGVILADMIGSISAGNTINAYIIADSFGNIHDHILIISTFLVARVTVGIVQIPAEIYFLGKKFTYIRNIIAFCFAIIGAYLIYLFYFIL